MATGSPSLVPQTGRPVYLVLNDYGHLGVAFVEADPETADLETIIDDLISGQYARPLRVVAMNVDEGWARRLDGRRG